jgi:hypothetical protein
MHHKSSSKVELSRKAFAAGKRQNKTIDPPADSALRLKRAGLRLIAVTLMAISVVAGVVAIVTVCLSARVVPSMMCNSTVAGTVTAVGITSVVVAGMHSVAVLTVVVCATLIVAVSSFTFARACKQCERGCQCGE